MNYPNFTEDEVSAIIATIPVDTRHDMQLKYSMHKSHLKNAAGSVMELTFEQWAAIWWESGHWHERGRHSDDYNMCRKGDEGLFQMGNVRIDTKRSYMAERKSWAKRIVVTNIKTGVETEFAGQKQAAQALNCSQGNISSVLRGKLKSLAGYTWRFKE